MTLGAAVAMIWENPFFMLAIDILMIAGFIATLFYFPGQKSFYTSKKTERSFIVMFTGLGVLVSFFILDLVALLMLPNFAPPENILAFLDGVHLSYAWVMFPIGFSLTLAGFILIIKSYAETIMSLAESRQSLSRELRTRQKIEKRLTSAQRVANMGNWEWNISNGKLWWSDQVFRIFGREPGEFEPTYEAFLETVHPDDKDKVNDEVSGSLNGEGSYSVKHRIVLPSGDIRVVEERGEVAKDKKGNPIFMLGTVLDVTEREELETQARLAGRIETVGQLAGGVAHNFNNLLMIIYGNLGYLIELLKDSSDIPKKEALDLAKQSLDAAHRGAALTKGLLAFVRQQHLEPHVLNVQETVEAMVGLLQTAMGSTIRLDIKLEEITWNTLVDPAGLENALLNLAVNARDAMPGGGTLTISTTQKTIKSKRKDGVTPGEYVVVSVTDTGTGIPKEIHEKILDPYFTTKPIGKGTGLGLSSVFGFVQQSKGHLIFNTAPNKGTTFEIYLPRTRQDIKTAVEKTGLEKLQGFKVGT